MKKQFKKITAILVAFLFAIILVSCGKKKTVKTTNNNTSINKTTNKTTTNKATTQEKGFTVSANNVSGVSYKLYKVVDGEKELVDNTQEFKKDDKVIIDIINRSDKNIIAKIGTDNEIELKNKSEKEFSEITITSDVTIDIKVTNKIYVDLDNREEITFSAYYYEGDKKVEYSDDFLVDSGTKVYFTAYNDTTYEWFAYAMADNKCLEYVKCNSKGGHDPKEASFNPEGLTLTANTLLSCADKNSNSFIEVSNDAEIATLSLTCINRDTNEEIDLSNNLDIFVPLRFTISNPLKKKVIVAIYCDDIVKYVFDDETFSFDWLSPARRSYMYLEDYGEASFKEINPDKENIETYFFAFDEDNIEQEAKEGVKFINNTSLYYRITNNTKHIINVLFSNKEESNIGGSLTIYPYETLTNYGKYDDGNMYIWTDTTVTITMDEEELTFYKVTFENKTGDSEFNGKLAYNMGMYNYPETEYNKDIVAGSEMVIVFDVESSATHTIRIYNSDTNTLIKEDSVGGSCAASFKLNSNIKVVVE